jgi:hypothetical protein
MLEGIDNSKGLNRLARMIGVGLIGERFPRVSFCVQRAASMRLGGGSTTFNRTNRDSAGRVARAGNGKNAKIREQLQSHTCSWFCPEWLANSLLRC